MGRRYCPPCEPRPHAVYMHFQQFGSWKVTFSLIPGQRSLGRMDAALRQPGEDRGTSKAHTGA